MTVKQSDPSARPPGYAEVARILQRAWGEDEGLIVLEFIFLGK